MDKLSKDVLEILESEGQYKLETNKGDDESPKIDDIPQYKISQKLTEEQITNLTTQVFDEYKSLKEERKKLKLEEEWQKADNQYNGELKQNRKLNFNLHTHQTKIKVDAIVRALNEAFLDSEPMADVSPRPEAFRSGKGDEIADRQTEFIDYAFDEEIQPGKDLTLINRSCVMKFLGIGKLEWAYKKERRRREERYEGKNEITGVDQQGKPIIENKAVKEFLANYPDAEQRYPKYLKQLMEEKKISIIVDYFDTVDNNPKLRYVPIENFYVRNTTNYNDGLRSAHLIVEKQVLSWWELKDKEENDEFVNVDVLRDISYDDSTQNSNSEKPENRDYKIIECTTYFKIEGAEEETKIKCWFEETTETFLGCILYPYFGYDTDYIAFYIKLNDEGFFGGSRSVLADLRDSNIAQDALLNLYLHSIYIRNTLTPIVKEGSELESIFAENRWTDGKPIPVEQTVDDVRKAFGFVEYPPINMNEMAGIEAMLKKIDDDVSGVSSLMTGRENPNDPRAPASKTIALLNQSGINVKDYIRIYLPSFNLFIGNVLQLYYQMSHEGRRYKVNWKSKQITGTEAFATITRDQMIAKTVIQSRAAAFAFDKMNEKQENMAMRQILMQDPYAMQLPKIQYEAIKQLMKSWSPMWKSIAETTLPSPEEFNQQMEQVAMQAMFKVVQGMQQQQQITGVPPQQPNPQQLGDTVKQAQMMATNAHLRAEAQKQNKGQQSNV